MSKKTIQMGQALSNDLHELSKRVIDRHSHMLNAALNNAMQLLDNYKESNNEEKFNALKTLENRLNIYVDSCKEEFKGFRYFEKEAKEALDAKEKNREDLVTALLDASHSPAIASGDVHLPIIDYHHGKEDELVKHLEKLVGDGEGSLVSYYQDKSQNGFVTKAEFAQELFGNVRFFLDMLKKEM